MTKIRRSPIGEEAEAGYTLVELLVVLTVMGLLVAAAPAVVSAAGSAVKLRAAAYDLANDLRAARSAAIITDTERRIIFDLGKGAYATLPDGPTRQIPAKMTILIERPAAESGTLAEIRFYTDGSSSGGTIRISMAGQSHAVIDHALTGRIAIDE